MAGSGTPRRWRDIRVIAEAHWRHDGEGAPKPRYGGIITVTTRTVNGEEQVWVSEKVTAQRQIASAAKQMGHVATTKAGSAAMAAGKTAAKTASKTAAAAARSQLHSLETGGQLDVDAQVAAAGRHAATTVAGTVSRVAAKKILRGANRTEESKTPQSRAKGKEVDKRKKGGLTDSVRKVGANLVGHTRSGVRLVGEGGQLDVDRTAARTAQRAWQKSLGVTGRAAGKAAKPAAVKSGKYAAQQVQKSTQWAAAKLAATVRRSLAVMKGVIGAVVGAAGALLPVVIGIIAIVTALCAILPSFITGVGAEQQRRVAAGPVSCGSGSEPRAAATPEEVAALFGPDPQGKDVSGDFTDEQRAIARVIVEEGIKAGVPLRGQAVALMTAMQESTMGADQSTWKPDENGDVGVFQQRAVVGWYADGSSMAENTKILNDVPYAARTFYTGHKVTKEVWGGAGPVGYQIPGLLDIEGWESMELADAAQAVQRSFNGSLYGYREATVAGLLPTLIIECTPTTGTPGSSGLAGVDDYYSWWQSMGAPRSGYDTVGFAWAQCTSYAAFAVRTYSRHTDFVNEWRGKKFGHAKEWHLGAEHAGIRVDQTPAVGAVAQRTTGKHGHVAYVVEVHSDGSFTINEYNHIVERGFSSRVAHVGTGSADFNNFLHFEE